MAYRGASAAFPEHSVGAYRVAIEEGARFIECDVVLTRDLVPLCRHEPNIAQTTDALLRPRPESSAVSEEPHRPDLGGGLAADGAVVLASDLTLAEIQQLLAIFPGSKSGPAAAAAVAAVSGAERQQPRCMSGGASVSAARGECGAPWATNATQDVDDGARAGAGVDARRESASAGVAARGAVAPDDPSADLRVASLEDLLRMATAVEPAVGVALHIQSAAWHNTALPQLAASNATFEELLLQLLEQYGYAAGPYGSEAWRRRPSYIMAFEAGSLRYLAARTSSPLTQVLGPTIPDTGESWDSATSPEGLARIASYAGSVAVARQQVLVAPPDSARSPAGSDGDRGGGGGARGLVASELLARIRRAGLQVFASVFKPAPTDQLLAGAETWADEVAPLVLGTGLSPETEGAMEPGAGGVGAGWVGRLGAAIDGLFTDSPRELHRLLAGFRCGGGGGDGGGGKDGKSVDVPADARA